MIETNLSMQDFTKYFENNRLGRLYFPNGKCYNHGGRAVQQKGHIPFNIELRDLYKMVTGWKINDTEVPLDDIIGVIAFGSAVKHPGYDKVSKIRKKYIIAGPEVTKTKQVPIHPRDADFLVVTGENLIRQKILEPLSIEIYDHGTVIKEGGIHLVNRGIGQVVSGVQANDTVSASAMREGVPIFYNGRMSDVEGKVGIKRETPRKVYWDEDREGYLVGKIN